MAWSNAPAPDYFSLSQDSPNPFNQETVIEYSLSQDCDVNLSIYNLLGQRIRTLVSERQKADDYAVGWDRRNEQDQEVASGIYLYKLDTRWRSDRRKMVVIR